MTTALDPERRASLLGAKLAALVGRGWGPGPSGPAATTAPFPGGAAVQRAGVAWILLEDQPERSLGASLAWARQREFLAPTERFTFDETFAPVLRRALDTM